MDIFFIQVPRHVPRFQELNKDLLLLLRPKSLIALYSTQQEHPRSVSSLSNEQDKKRLLSQLSAYDMTDLDVYQLTET